MFPSVVFGPGFHIFTTAQTQAFQPTDLCFKGQGEKRKTHTKHCFCFSQNEGKKEWINENEKLRQCVRQHLLEEREKASKELNNPFPHGQFPSKTCPDRRVSYQQNKQQNKNNKNKRAAFENFIAHKILREAVEFIGKLYSVIEIADKKRTTLPVTS